jgi:hypothetical protein
MEYGIDVGLSERELLSIGKIVALWASLEYEVFCQTLESFSAISSGQFPKEMNNMQFSQVLALWETHVVNKAVGKRKEILQEQHKNILLHHEFRNAIVHGMWDWSRAVPEKITAIRIRKKEVIRAHFTADDLASFASALDTINFSVRYPGGIEELAAEGSSMSRRAFWIMAGNPLPDDYFSTVAPKEESKP